MRADDLALRDDDERFGFRLRNGVHRDAARCRQLAGAQRCPAHLLVTAFNVVLTSS